jgi:hypothetical protein
MTPQTSDADATLDPDFALRLLDRLADTLQPDGDTEAARSAHRAALRTAFVSMQPRTPMQAMLAAEVISAHHVIMDCYRRALLPGADPGAAARARSSAATLSRVRLATLQAFATLQAPSSPPAATPERQRATTPCTVTRPGTVTPSEEVSPITEGWTAQRSFTAGEAPASGYVARDRTGAPIPNWRWEDMTMAQRRATYGGPDDLALQAEAIAEENAMIAAAAGKPGDDAAVLP